MLFEPTPADLHRLWFASMDAIEKIEIAEYEMGVGKCDMATIVGLFNARKNLEAAMVPLEKQFKQARP